MLVTLKMADFPGKYQELFGSGAVICCAWEEQQSFIHCCYTLCVLLFRCMDKVIC